MFATTTYRERRERLKSLMGSGLALFLGNEESARNYADNIYPFRQDSSFLYFFGLDVPGLAAVVDLDSKVEVIFGDDPTLDDIVWMGPQATLGEMAERAGVTEVQPSARLTEVLAEARARRQPIHFLPPYRSENRQKLEVWLDLFAGSAGEVASVEMIEAVVALRSIKSPEEVAEINRAADVTADMQLAAMTAARTGSSEAKVVAEIQRVATASGGCSSFPPIVSVHGEILHNPHHHNLLNDGDLLLCDAGAETVLHYAADMTRTFPIAPTFTSQQREIYEVVLAAQEAAVEALEPGVRFLDVHLLAARTITASLQQIGLMRGDIDAAVAAGAHALFFPHGLGHMMGLDVHDMEDLGEDHVGYQDMQRSSQFGLKSLRLARELQPGFVLTVEPGVYFIPPLIDRWQGEGRHSDFIDYDAVASFRTLGGIRLEEDFLITTEGSRLLGKPAAKSVADVEDIRMRAVG